MDNRSGKSQLEEKGGLEIENMKQIAAKIGLFLFCLVLVFSVAGCGSSVHTNGIPDPDKIVPAREILIENLEDSGYNVTIYTAVEGADLLIDRVVAEKGSKFIDITYGLSVEDTGGIFEAYCALYGDDYYILAHNGNYVYCVSDKRTFSKAGFTTTANVGVQYIHE